MAFVHDEGTSCTWVAIAVFSVTLLGLLWLHFAVVSPRLVKYFRQLQEDEIKTRINEQALEAQRLQALADAAKQQQIQQDLLAKKSATSKPKINTVKKNDSHVKITKQDIHKAEAVVNKGAKVVAAAVKQDAHKAEVAIGTGAKKAATVVKQDAQKVAAKAKQGLKSIGKKLHIK